MTTTARAAAPARHTTSQRLTAISLLVVTIAASAVIGALAGGSPALAFFAVMAAVGAIVIAIRPELAVLIVVGLIYSNTPVVLVQFHDMPLILAGVVPLILAAPLAYDILIERRPIIITPALPWIAAYLVFSIVSAIFAKDPSGATSYLVTFAVEGLALYVLITNTIRSPQLLRGVIWTLLLVGGFLGALSFIQQATGMYDNAFFGFAQTQSALAGVTATGFERLAGPVGEKNRYAQIMLMIVPLAIMQATCERRQVLRVIALGCAALAAIAVALTFSRGAALAAGMIVMAMVGLRVLRISHVLAAIAIVGVVLLAVPSYGERVATLTDIGALLSDEPASSETDNSLLSRATENLAALSVVLDHPILGVGPGQFPLYYRDYADAIGVNVKAADREAHNLYLGIAAETGILGLTAFLGAAGATILQLIRARSRALRARPDLAAMATGFLLAMIAYLGTGLFLHLSYQRYYWLMLALAGAAAVVIHAEMRRIESTATAPGSAGTAAQEPYSQSA